MSFEMLNASVAASQAAVAKTNIVFERTKNAQETIKASIEPLIKEMVQKGYTKCMYTYDGGNFIDEICGILRNNGYKVELNLARCLSLKGSNIHIDWGSAYRGSRTDD